MDRLFSKYGFVFVASCSITKHLIHLNQAFTTLQEADFCINPEKCVFAQPTVDYLGHRISTGGLVPLRRQVEAV